MKKLLIILFTLSFSLLASAQIDSVRHEARYWAERGYFNKSLEALRQLPYDSLTVSDMRLRYDNFANLGNIDSLFYWGDQILKRDPYNIPLILDYTPRLNRGKVSDLGKRVTYPEKVIDICQKYRERDTTHILVNRQLAEAYYNMGNYDLAMPALKQLEALGDTCFGTLYTLGLTYQRMGDNNSAYDYLSRATVLRNDEHGWCLFNLGIVCNKIGFGAEALSYLEMAKERLMPDRRTLFRMHKELAEAFRMKGENDFRLEPSWRFIPNKTLIFFDELQKCPDCATSLKSFCQDKRYDVICSGSMMGIYYEEIESNAVGFKDDFDMFSMDFEEFLWAKGYQPEQIEDLYRHMVELKPFSQIGKCKKSSLICEVFGDFRIQQTFIPKVGIFHSQAGNILFPRWDFLSSIVYSYYKIMACY